jgi:hypothetical protein
MTRAMDARRAVEIVQAESEATRDMPIPEGIRGERRGRGPVASPAELDSRKVPS